jgi:deoxyadenosine/deoxycytidine kinase
MTYIITIEGNIGAGKSTFVKFLKEECDNLKLSNIIFLQEPVDEWTKIKVDGITILEKFYQEPDKYAFTFQMMAYISRLAILQKAIEENPNAIIISERCLLTDKHVFAKMLYDSNNIDPYSFQIYNLWFDHFYNKLPNHKHIYLKSSPELIKFRINKRNRTGENNIDINYLTKCHNYHSEYFSTNENLLIAVDMDKIELYSNDLNDITNVNYKILINDIISLITSSNA